MMEIKKSILISTLAILISSCGQHESTTHFFEKNGEQRRGEKATDPGEMMEEAIFDGNKDLVAKLLDEGFQIDSLLPNAKKTVLAEAVFREKLVLIRFLVQRGASFDMAQIDEQKVVDWVTAQGAQKKHLLRSLTKSDEDDKIELFIAVSQGKFREIQVLFQEGVNPNVHFDDGETPFTLAIQKKIVNSIRVLLGEKTMDVNLKNKNGDSPLKLARQLNLKSVVDELTKRRANE